MGKLTERIVNADRVDDLIAVFGSFDENIKRIEEALNVQIINRGTDMKVSGDEENVDKAVRTLEGLLALALPVPVRPILLWRQLWRHSVSGRSTASF